MWASQLASPYDNFSNRAGALFFIPCGMANDVKSMCLSQVPKADEAELEEVAWFHRQWIIEALARAESKGSSGAAFYTAGTAICSHTPLQFNLVLMHQACAPDQLAPHQVLRGAARYDD